MQEAYSKLPQEVKDLLREHRYTITVSNQPWLKEEETSFGYTNAKEHTIHISETATADGETVFIEKTFDDVTEALTHEIGHALDNILGLSVDTKFVEKWKADIPSLNQDNFLKGFKSGDGENALNYSNETKNGDSDILKGAQETAAELMSFMLGSKYPIAEHVKNASTNAYNYLKTKELW